MWPRSPKRYNHEAGFCASVSLGPRIGRSWPRSPKRYNFEADFSLVEVLAALTIASLTIVAALSLFTQSARVNDRMIKETAARDLARRLVVTEAVGRGQAGALGWVARPSPPDQGLVLHQVAVTWAGGPQITLSRLEPVP